MSPVTGSASRAPVRPGRRALWGFLLRLRPNRLPWHRMPDSAHPLAWGWTRGLLPHAVAAAAPPWVWGGWYLADPDPVLSHDTQKSLLGHTAVPVLGFEDPPYCRPQRPRARAPCPPPPRPRVPPLVCRGTVMPAGARWRLAAASICRFGAQSTFSRPWWPCVYSLSGDKSPQLLCPFPNGLLLSLLSRWRSSFIFWKPTRHLTRDSRLSLRTPRSLCRQRLRPDVVLLVGFALLPVPLLSDL